jgi:sugar lactone lactonase YvrE
VRTSIGRNLVASLGLLLSLCSGAVASDTKSEDSTLRNTRGVEHFATLPAGFPGRPEGLCADHEGNIYADSFDLTAAHNFVYTFSPRGELLASTQLEAGVVPLGCFVVGKKFYMNNVISGTEVVFNLPSDPTQPLIPDTTFKICDGFPVCAINANYVGPDGRIYISDNGDATPPFGTPNFKGRIWVVDPNGGAHAQFFPTDDNDIPALDITKGPPFVPAPDATRLPFSINGIAFSRDGKALYMANMNTNKIYKLTVHHCSNITGCEPGELSLFSDDPRIQGPDNMDFDKDGNLWVASGQNDHVIALNPDGKVIGVFGKFKGLTPDGAPRGLLQPSGVIFSKGHIYIGNESNTDLVPPTKAAQFANLKLFTISRIDVDVLEKRGQRHDDEDKRDDDDRHNDHDRHY